MKTSRIGPTEEMLLKVHLYFCWGQCSPVLFLPFSEKFREPQREGNAAARTASEITVE
jgi:hypothetical protein